MARGVVKHVSRAGALSGGSKAPGVVKGDTYASRAQHHRTAATARRTRCDGSLPSPLHLAIKRKLFPDDVSTRGDVDAYSRAL